MNFPVLSIKKAVVNKFRVLWIFLINVCTWCVGVKKAVVNKFGVLWIFLMYVPDLEVWKIAHSVIKRCWFDVVVLITVFAKSFLLMQDRHSVIQTVIFYRTDKYLQDWRHSCCQNIIFFAKMHRTFVRETKSFCRIKWKNASFVRQSCTFRKDCSKYVYFQCRKP